MAGLNQHKSNSAKWFNKFRRADTRIDEFAERFVRENSEIQLTRLEDLISHQK